MHPMGKKPRAADELNLIDQLLRYSDDSGEKFMSANIEELGEDQQRTDIVITLLAIPNN